MSKIRLPFASKVLLLMFVFVFAISITVYTAFADRLNEQGISIENNTVSSERIEILVENTELEYIQELQDMEYYADVKYVFKDASQDIVPSTSVSWSTSDDSIIVIKQNGALVPKAPGKAVISAEYNGLHDSKEITVKKVHIKKLDVIEATTDPFLYSVVAETPGGEKIDITSSQDIQWASDCSSISIKSGKLHINNNEVKDMEKEVKITALFKGISADTSFKIKNKIIDNGKIRLNKDQVLIEDVNGVVPVHALVDLPDGKTRDITGIVVWTSENTGVADVFEGRIYANSEGATMINVDYNGCHKSIKVTVQPTGQNEQAIHPIP